MIGNNNFYFNYNSFLLNNSNFISPSQNVGTNNTFNKKPDNTSKNNIDNSSFSFDSTHTDTQDKSVFNNFSNSLSDFAGLNNIQNENKNNTQQYSTTEKISDFIDNIYIHHDDKTYNAAIEKVDKYKKNIINSANNCAINPGLLYGVLVAEQMRIGFDDNWDKEEGKSKGFSQITVDSAIQGERFFRQNHHLPPLTDDEISKLKEKLNKDLNDPKKTDLNIDYAAKYISFLQSQFPLDNKNLNREEQSKLIAAAYKAGPEVVRNARMQEQLNDLLNLKGDKKLTTDGYMGSDDTSKTKTAILSLINNYFNDPKLEYKRGTILKNIDNPDRYRAIIDDLWQTWAKKNNIHKNPTGSVPESYIMDPNRWRGDVPLSVEDVFKAQKHFLKTH